MKRKIIIEIDGSGNMYIRSKGWEGCDSAKLQADEVNILARALGAVCGSGFKHKHLCKRLVDKACGIVSTVAEQCVEEN